MRLPSAITRCGDSAAGIDEATVHESTCALTLGKLIVGDHATLAHVVQRIDFVRERAQRAGGYGDTRAGLREGKHMTIATAIGPARISHTAQKMTERSLAAATTAPRTVLLSMWIGIASIIPSLSEPARVVTGERLAAAVR